MTAEATVAIRNRLGLHARAATKLVQTAQRFRADVHVIRGETMVNGKSIMGVLMLAAAQGTAITVRAVGEDAEEAVRALVALVEGKFGEES